MSEGLDLVPIITDCEARGRPLAEVEPNGMLPGERKPGPLSTVLADALSLICTKIAPTMSAEQAGAWVRVMVAALANLPGRTAIRAAQRVLQRPIAFISEVDGAIREEAKEIALRHALATRRIRELAALRERELPAIHFEPEGDDQPIAPEKIRAMPAPLREMGLAAGWITEAEVAAALATGRAA
ncbi:hypothetical protein GO308_12790 [Sphingomonas sp. SFZ2018-12]|uniref:hypothetical protein n=1 Tax=Sphingomonas sp. SFZ2018-12 TaxID=2683197 RepID=UPI001F0D9395|nr:hypothetical protein [Sphingomonas sp. SFZ2018-12]MCH4893992.1 hypothetical protein [Sphingomonas sp. SFZ2018-12]